MVAIIKDHLRRARKMDLVDKLILMVLYMREPFTKTLKKGREDRLTVMEVCNYSLIMKI